MKTGPIVPATITLDERGVPWSPMYRDIYHPVAGAREQARHVFIAGNGLPQRWQGQERHVILETGFGLGHNFLATWQAWRDDPNRCRRLVFISVEQHPCSTSDLRRLHREDDPLAAQLIDAWPPLTANLHSLNFEDDRVLLLLALGDVQDWLREITATVDTFYLDGFAPARNPRMWEPRLYKALARLAAPDATLATWSAAAAVRDGLQSAGFEARKAAGRGGKRDITLARYAPTFLPRRAPARLGAATRQRHAVIVGAGLAGCATARALALQGWSSTLIDRHAAPAQATSGNPAGLFHGIVNAQDGLHARFNRAAALRAERVIAQAVETHGVAGAVEGLLRLDASSAAQLQGVLNHLGLPQAYAQALDASQASERCGLPLAQAAWYFPGGGWAEPAGLCKVWAEQAATRFLGHTLIAQLRRAGSTWQLLDERGAVVEESDVVVLANAHDASRLLPGQDWPLELIRGQVSWAPWSALHPLNPPRVPIAGAGYLLPDVNGRAVFGATAQLHDDDAAVREDDHMSNLAQLGRLLNRPLDVSPQTLAGRTGWRCSAYDRLPVIGPVPDLGAALARADQPRLLPRLPGLYVCTALGSRGITWAALGAEALAAWITGAPSPLESSLLDAIDPGRFVSRASRRASPTATATPSGAHTPEGD